MYVGVGRVERKDFYPFEETSAFILLTRASHTAAPAARVWEMQTFAGEQGSLPQARRSSVRREQRVQ